MIQAELLNILSHLQQLPDETEVVEFKEAKNDYDFNKIGKYFSAISNEANLRSLSHGWLIFGVEDKKKAVVGSHYRINRPHLDSLKGEIANKTTNRITFIEIYELLLGEGRVILFQIPAAPRGIPVAWDGHYYARDGEELAPLNIEKLERIRNQQVRSDWSAEICSDATLADLDEAAILQARKNYKDKFPEKANDVDTWDDATFLNKAKVTIKNKITRTAIILLGRPESEYFISPAVAKIRWVLKGSQSDYQIETCPLLLAVDKIYSKIRNVKYRRILGNTLFPDEMLSYEPYVIREAINNCIAHQDYSLHGYINIVETDDSLVFTNLGSFIPESVEKVVIENAPEEYYRNRFLAEAMFNMKMVDTAGGGIYKMFLFQKQRFFPLPEYELRPDRVQVTITGKILDMDFARVLAENPDLSLLDIILLDKLQKGKKLNEGEAKHLRSKQLIEGKKPNYFISASAVNPLTNAKMKAQYIHQRGFDDDHYKKMILDFINKFGSASRKEIDELILPKLPDVLDEEKKKNKVNNLISSLRIAARIKNTGSAAKPCWVSS